MELAGYVVSGRLALSEALKKLPDKVDLASFTLSDTQAVAKVLSQLAATRSRETGLALAELSRAVAEAMPDDDSTDSPVNPLELGWLRTVTAALVVQADWALYRRARDTGARLLRRARRAQSAELANWTHAELAQLHLQPIVARNTSDNLATDTVVHLWYEQGRASNDDNCHHYPLPQRAFTIAGWHYRRAAALAQGADRGRAIKGQVNALEMLGKSGVDIDLAGLGRLAGEALPLLNPIDDFVDLSYLMGMQLKAGAPFEQKIVMQLMQLPLEQFLKRVGPRDTLTAHSNLAALLGPSDRRAALLLVTKAAPALRGLDDEALSARFHHAILHSLAHFLCDAELDKSIGPIEAAQRIKERAEVEDWSLEKIAGAFLLMASRSSAQNLEHEGLRLLDAAAALIGEVTKGYEESLQYLRMVLWSGAGVNAAEIEDDPEALRCYGAALSLSMRLGFREFALKHLQYVAKLAQRDDGSLTLSLIGIAFEQGLAIETVLGNRAWNIYRTSPVS